MNDIKIDVEFITEQANNANEALENMMFCIESLKKTYSDILDDMESKEFIREFDESIEQLLKQVDKVSEGTVEGIIQSLSDLSEAFEQQDKLQSNI